MKLAALFVLVVVLSFVSSYQFTKFVSTSGGTEVLEVVSATIAPSPTPKLTNTLTPKPTKKLSSLDPFLSPTPTLPPAPRYVSQPKFTDEEINNFISRFAGQYEVDAEVLKKVAECESGSNADAINGIYVGLFQFDSGSWRSLRDQMGEESDPNIRFNAEESVQTAAFALSNGRGSIWPNCIP